MPTPPGAALAEVFAKRRGRFNAQFADARRFRPGLDPESFKEHLKTTVAPVLERVAVCAPERVDAAAMALYELSLDLVGQELLGPRSRYPALVAGWQRLLVALAAHVAEAPRSVAGAITNALYHLSITPGTRPTEWIEAVEMLAEAEANPSILLEAAKVAAWRAGLAHYRAGALDLSGRLPPHLAALALGLSGPEGASLTSARLADVVTRLRDDPWLDPAAALAEPGAPRRLQLVRRVGAFRGFGGLFMAPPMVICPSGQFVVSDGTGHWLLCADRFGATFHRSAAPLNGPAAMSEPFYRLDTRGKVTRGRHSATFPELAGSQSSAADGATLAVTTPLSHAIYLVALVTT